MYNPGDEYLNYIKNNQIRKPRSKIIVDGKTYTGVEHLATYPKISQETEKMIGGFPAKTCEFEIYNLDGSLSLNGKEVEVYRGLDIEDNKTVWIPMGLFTANDEDITNNSTKRTIQFKGTDRTRLFDVAFGGYADNIIPKSTTIVQLVEEICTPKGLSLDPDTQSNVISYSFKEDIGLPARTTDRQVISWAAELSGCIPIISRDGKCLCFTRPSVGAELTKKSRYKTLSAEPQFGLINALSLGHSDYDDAYVIQDDEAVKANGICEWQINDNSLAENDRQNLAELAFKKIKGMKIVPFSLTEFVDDYVYDINDGILVEAKDGSTISTNILGISTSSRIRSTFKANTQETSVADRSLAGSVKQDITNVKLEVNHIEGKITAIVKESEEKYTQFEQTVEGIKGEIVDLDNNLTTKINATAEKAELAYSKSESVEGQIDGVTDQIKNINSQVSSINSDLAGINSELDGLDEDVADKVTTEVRKETTIEYLAGQVSTKIKGEYVSQSTYNTDKDKWLLKTTYESDKTQTDQNITSALARLTALETSNFITEEQANSLISQSADSISLSVEKSLKIGARNILLNSACFWGFPAYNYAGNAVLVNSVSNDNSVPSGKYLVATFTGLRDDSGNDGYSGFCWYNVDTIGEENDSIAKIKPNTTYTLSFWLKDGTGNATTTYSLNYKALVYVKDGNVSYDITRGSMTEADTANGTLPVSANWKLYTITFTTPNSVSRFYLRFFFKGCTVGTGYRVFISSLKIEEGNIATDWSPSAEDVEQSVKAQIDMCVKTDENGKLVSKILVESNKLEINTDKFTLTEEGAMTCADATIEGTVICGEGDYGMKISAARITHTLDGAETGHVSLSVNRLGQLAETLYGTNSVVLMAGEQAIELDSDGSIHNGWKLAGTEIFAGYKHYRQFVADTSLEVLTCATGIYSDKTLGVELYGQQSKRIECAIKIKREDYDTSSVTIYGFKQHGDEYITSPGLSLRTDGLYYNGKKLAYA